MRAVVWLVPMIAAAAVAVASAPPGYDPGGNDMMDLNMQVDLNAFETIEAEMNASGPAWLSGGNWIYGGSEESGANWYIDVRTTDLETRPIRVMVRADESTVAGSRYGFTERELSIDCAKYRYRVERTRHYDRAGRSAGPEQRGGGPLVRAAPESVYASVAQQACYHGTMTDEMLANSTLMNGM
ncbi:MAG TPA: hypothetical protein VGC46_09085 [Allosphingosinicella sp.]